MKKILVVTTALLVFVSCKKENPENENLDKQGKIQLPAEIEAPSLFRFRIRSFCLAFPFCFD